MKKILFAMFALLVAGSAWAQAVGELRDLLTAETFGNPAGPRLLYRQYFPTNLAADAKVPLVLFFHGAGERGTNNTAQLVHGVGPLVRYSRSRKTPIALIAPQCPPGRQWVDTPWGGLAHRMAKRPSTQMKLAMELLADRIRTLPVDTNRIYVTGISMGGYGTWDLIQREPDLFAAALPVCGGGDATLAWRLRDLPVWASHGSADPVVPVARSRSMVSALWACDGKIRYREIPGAGHAVWGPVYDDEKVLDWFFSQRKR